MLSLVIGTPAAYALLRFPFRYKQTLVLEILSVRMVPPIVAVIPIFVISQALGLYDTYTILILMYVAFNLPFVIWVMRAYLADIPIELEDAALVDGATRLQAFLRVVLPLARPGIATCLILVFVFCWNEFPVRQHPRFRRTPNCSHCGRERDQAARGALGSGERRRPPGNRADRHPGARSAPHRARAHVGRPEVVIRPGLPARGGKRGMASMAAAVWYGPGRENFRLEELERPEPGPNEVVMRVRACYFGAMHVRAVLRGHPELRPPEVFGRMVAGDVAAVGANVDGIQEGMRITVNPEAPCGRCFTAPTSSPFTASISRRYVRGDWRNTSV